MVVIPIKEKVITLLEKLNTMHKVEANAIVWNIQVVCYEQCFINSSLAIKEKNCSDVATVFSSTLITYICVLHK
jgi:hypothetical protein